MPELYQSSAVVTKRPARRVVPGVTPVTVEFEATTALALNDVIEMVPVQAGMTVLDVILSTEDLDSGTDLTLSVGDGPPDAAHLIRQGGQSTDQALTSDDTFDPRL